MRVKYKSSASGGAGCLALIAVCLLSALVGMFPITYSVNSWLEWAGKPEVFKLYHGFLIGLIPAFGFGSIPAAILTFILSFFF
jgi:hypothetical protein